MDSSKEQLSIYRALLKATQSLAHGHTPDDVLREACDALVTSSDRVCLAWMYLGNPNAEIIRPCYAVGRSHAYCHGLELDLSPEAAKGPGRRSLAKNSPVMVEVDFDPTFEIWRAKAVRHGLKEGLTLPIGDPKHPFRGLIVIFTDTQNYFRDVGIEPFIAFAQLATVALEEARLKLSLEALASVDPLTQLLNRRAFQEIVTREHSRAKRLERPFSLLLFDIDRFKMLNDNYGHDMGDAVLVGVSNVAKNALRNSDWLSRWGGEEFLAILPDTDEVGALYIAERLRASIEQFSVDLHTQKLKTSVSIGIASYPRDGDTSEFLLKAADAALYVAKKSGRNRVVEAKDKREVYSIAGKINTAIETHQLFTAYQPIVDLKTRNTVAEEALARLIDESGTVIEAVDFIHAAMELQLMHLVDYRVIMQALQRCAVNMAESGQIATHFVNVSSDILLHPGLVKDLFAEAKLACLSCGANCSTKPLVLEITERQLLGDAEVVKAKLAPFLDFGIRLAIDDFGSGYSSLHYLADLPVSFLKIEGSLIKRIKEKRARQIVKRIGDIARDFEVITIAEYVEDADTADILTEMGIDWAQGHFLGRPVLER